MCSSDLSNLAWHYSSALLGPLISLEFDGTARGFTLIVRTRVRGTPGSGDGANIVFGPLFPKGIGASIIATYSSAVALDGLPRKTIFTRNCSLTSRTVLTARLISSPRTSRLRRKRTITLFPNPLRGRCRLGDWQSSECCYADSSPEVFGKRRGMKAPARRSSLFFLPAKPACGTVQHSCSGKLVAKVLGHTRRSEPSCNAGRQGVPCALQCGAATAIWRVTVGNSSRNASMVSPPSM